MRDLAIFAVLWLLYLEVRASVLLLERALVSRPKCGPGRALGLQIGAFLKCLMFLVLGFLSLGASRIAFVLFALIVLWGSVRSGNAAASHVRDRLGWSKNLAAAAGAAWVGATRLAPLFLVYWAFRREWS